MHIAGTILFVNIDAISESKQTISDQTSELIEIS